MKMLFAILLIGSTAQAWDSFAIGNNAVYSQPAQPVYVPSQADVIYQPPQSTWINADGQAVHGVNGGLPLNSNGGVVQIDDWSRK
jgi:hypothetical protein